MRAILTYHSVDASNSVISVDRDTFSRHVEWLCEARVPVCRLSELAVPGGPEGIALTFDDGFDNFATEAWPILRAHGLPATVFVVSEWVGRDNGWDSEDAGIPQLPLMDWSTLTELSSEGLDVGGHTRTHPDMRKLRGAELRAEIEVDRATIGEATGTVPTAFAYPYGHYDAEAVDAVGRAGYTHAVTTRMGLLAAKGAPLELPRLDAFYLRRPGALEAWGSGSFRRFVAFRAGARRVRRMLERTGIPL